MVLQTHFTIQGTHKEKKKHINAQNTFIVQKMIQIKQDLPYNNILHQFFTTQALHLLFYELRPPTDLYCPPPVDCSPVAAELNHCEHGPHSLFTCELSPAAAQPEPEQVDAKGLLIFSLTFEKIRVC